MKKARVIVLQIISLMVSVTTMLFIVCEINKFESLNGKYWNVATIILSIGFIILSISLVIFGKSCKDIIRKEPRYEIYKDNYHELIDNMAFDFFLIEKRYAIISCLFMWTSVGIIVGEVFSELTLQIFRLMNLTHLKM